MNDNTEFEYVGGNIWALVTADHAGYECHKLSVEIDGIKKRKHVTILSYEPTMVTKEDLQKLANLITTTENE